MTTRNPFLLPSEVADDVSDLLAPGYLLAGDLELLDDLTDEIETGKPVMAETCSQVAARLHNQAIWLASQARTLEAKAFAGRANEHDLATAAFLRRWEAELNAEIDALLDEIPVADPLTLDPEADRPMTEEEFAAYDKWVTEQEAEWIRKNGPVPF